MKRKNDTTGNCGAARRSRHGHDDPNIKSLYAENANSLPDVILRRLAVVGCEIDRNTDAAAKAIVNAKIKQSLTSPKYAEFRDHIGEPGVESKVTTYLVLDCAQEFLPS